MPVNTSRTTNYEFELAFGVHTCRLDHYYFYIYLSLKHVQLLKSWCQRCCLYTKQHLTTVHVKNCHYHYKTAQINVQFILPPHLCHQQTNHHARQQDTHDTQAHG